VLHHVVLSQGAEEQCGWGERQKLRELVGQQTQHLSQICRRCAAELDGDVLRQCEELEAEHRDPSVVDIFRYFNVMREGRSEGNMGSHYDPGLFTLKPVSKVPGLDVLDRETGEWVDVEAVATPGQDLLLFCGETLEMLTEGEFKATSHRVHTEGQERFSMVYEMRSHHVC
jgi:isopenicillin N synthase-like dioxygenase